MSNTSQQSQRQADGRAFDFIHLNRRDDKPRLRGLTEIRGPYYSPMGPHYLTDLFDMMGSYVDSLKFAGGSFALMPRTSVRRLIEIAHEHDVLGSTAARWAAGSGVRFVADVSVVRRWSDAKG